MNRTSQPVVAKLTSPDAGVVCPRHRGTHGGIGTPRDLNRTLAWF